MPEIDVKAVSADTWQALSELFKSSDYTKNCWCMWPRVPAGKHQPSELRNKRCIKKLIRCGRSPGLIAALHGKGVGWCALGPLSEYPQYRESEYPENCWAVACLFVAPNARGIGVSASLLQVTRSIAEMNGVKSLTGPPQWWLPEDSNGIAAVINALRSAGFVQIGEGHRLPKLLCSLGDHSNVRL